MKTISHLKRLPLIAILVGACFVYVGCGKNDAGTAASSDAAASGAGDGIDAPAGKGDKDAVAAVRDELARHWLKTPDGWLSEFPSKVSIGTGQRAGPESFYRQIKALKFEIEPSELSESDKLNGVQFRGICQFDHAPYRIYNDPNAFGGPSWSQWQPCQEAASIEKRNGQWTVVGVAGGYLVSGAKPAADVVARLK